MRELAPRLAFGQNTSMMTLQQRLEKLRHLLYDAPSETTWYSLCALLHRWPAHEGLDTAMEYTYKHLSTAEAWREITSIDWVPGCWVGKSPNTHQYRPHAQLLEKLGWTWNAVALFPGTFQMGSPEDEPFRNDDEHHHTVTITRPLVVWSSPITVGQWSTLEPPPRAASQNPHHPLTHISWLEAVQWCNHFSRSSGMTEAYQVQHYDWATNPTVFFHGPETHGWRLPTEAEWEYVCRSGTSAPHYGPLKATAWYAGNSKGCPQPVKMLRPNAWGLYDTLGNVGEWCWDEYRPLHNEALIDPYAKNPRAPWRVWRGGAWNQTSHFIRAARRSQLLWNAWNASIGLRCVRTLILPS